MPTSFLTTGRVVALVNVPPYTLHHWAKVLPDYVRPVTIRHRTYWRIEHLNTLQAIRRYHLELGHSLRWVERRLSMKG